MNQQKSTKILAIILIAILAVSLAFNFSGAFKNKTAPATAAEISTGDQDATMLAIKKVLPAVVSIVVSDYQQSISVNMGTGAQTINKQKVEKGSGTGVLISSDGLILTNKHIVNAGKQPTAEYRVILSSGKKYYAQLIGTDPLNDLAILKIFDKNLPSVELGDSDKLGLGQTVIAIGNVLGRYPNSVTKGIVSGLGRSLVASDNQGGAEALDNVIQTDAEINLGNSGGPLIDLSGKVVGLNVAIDETGKSIGFAIPINDAKPVVRTAKDIGRIVRPFLGVRYVMLNRQVADDNNIKFSKGALIIKDETGPAIVPNSPADKAGLKEGDIIIEINGIKIDGLTTLLSVVQNYKPSDKMGVKIQRGNTVISKTVVLEELK